MSRHGGATSIAGGTVLRFLWQVSNLVKRLKHQDSVLQAFLELFVIYSRCTIRSRCVLHVCLTPAAGSAVCL